MSRPISLSSHACFLSYCPYFSYFHCLMLTCLLPCMLSCLSPKACFTLMKQTQTQCNVTTRKTQMQTQCNVTTLWSKQFWSKVWRKNIKTFWYCCFKFYCFLYLRHHFHEHDCLNVRLFDCVRAKKNILKHKLI